MDTFLVSLSIFVAFQENSSAVESSQSEKCDKVMVRTSYFLSPDWLFIKENKLIISLQLKARSVGGNSLRSRSSLRLKEGPILEFKKIRQMGAIKRLFGFVKKIRQSEIFQF